MKSLRLSALLLLLLSGSVLLRAEETVSASSAAAVQRAKVNARFAQYQDRLQLTPAQQDQLKPIFVASSTWLRDWKQRLDAVSSGGDRRALLREARRHQGETEKQIEPVLTDAQKKAWKQIRKERRAELKAAYENRVKI